jgi:hypothetical protein
MIMPSSQTCVAIALAFAACAPALPRPAAIEEIAEVEPTVPERTVVEEATLDPRLEGLHLRCTSDLCPDGIGLVVRAGHPRLARCTGALVDSDEVLTASHCLEESMRRAGSSCAGVWIAFPSTDERQMEWVPCQEVLEVSSGPVTVLRPDHARVRLGRPVDREVMDVHGGGLEGGEIVTVLSVTPHPIYPRHHRVEGRLCPLVSREEVLEVLGPRARWVAWLRDCPILHGNSGSPVLDVEGRIRGIVHGGSDPVLRVGVMSDLSTGSPEETEETDETSFLEGRLWVDSR